MKSRLDRLIELRKLFTHIDVQPDFQDIVTLEKAHLRPACPMPFLWAEIIVALDREIEREEQAERLK